MQKSYLVLDELGTTLRHWEDLNLFGKAISRLKKISSDPLLQGMIRSMGIHNACPGSEIDDRGFLVQEIRNYHGLHAALENQLSVPFENFLPRVPTQAAGLISRLELSRSPIRTNPIFLFPYSILRWNEFKKVYSVEDAQLIPRTPVSVHSCLSMMPFDAFILRFENKLVFELPGSKVTKEYSSFICSRDNDILDIFCLPANMENCCMKPGTRDFFRALTKGDRIDVKLFRKKINLLTSFDPGKQNLSITKFSVNINTGHFLFDHNIALDENGVAKRYWYDVYSEPVSLYTDSDSSQLTHDIFKLIDPGKQKDMLTMQKIIVEMVNGFCYSLAKLLPREKLELAPGSKKIPEQAPKNHEYGWNVIPVTQTQFLKPSDIPEETRLVFTTGSEKSPHWRRGHYRIIIQKDGSEKAIWIEATLVREDKIASEGLPGNVIKIKEQKKQK